ASPDLVADPRRFRDTSRALAEIDEVVALWRTYQAVARQVEQARELLADAATDPDLARLAADEAADGDRELEQLEGRLRPAPVPGDPDDDRNVVLEVRAGTGGGEAPVVAAELFRMYTRYAERRGWRVEVLVLSEADAGGIKEVAAIIEGRGAWSRLKYEAG